MKRILEYLIAVFLLLVILAIAIPNFIEAKMRSQVANTKKELRQTSEALAAYYVDHHAYPGVVPLRSFSFEPKYDSATVDFSTRDPHLSVLERAGGLKLSAIDPGLSSGTLAAGLTTPVAYLPSLPHDPFMNIEGEKNIPFAYHAYPGPANPGFFLWSTGPDQDYDIIDSVALFNPEKREVSKRIRVVGYNPIHPMNGDLFWFEPRDLNKFTPTE
jgi:hypothetical protein